MHVNVRVNVRQRPLTCVNARGRRRTSPDIDGYIQYMQMLYVNVMCQWYSASLFTSSNCKLNTWLFPAW